jgi:hypothetical protein
LFDGGNPYQGVKIIKWVRFNNQVVPNL